MFLLHVTVLRFAFFFFTDFKYSFGFFYLTIYVKKHEKHSHSELNKRLIFITKFAKVRSII